MHEVRFVSSLKYGLSLVKSEYKEQCLSMDPKHSIID